MQSAFFQRLDGLVHVPWTSTDCSTMKYDQIVLSFLLIFQLHERYIFHHFSCQKSKNSIKLWVLYRIRWTFIQGLVILIVYLGPSVNFPWTFWTPRFDNGMSVANFVKCKSSHSPLSSCESSLHFLFLNAGTFYSAFVAECNPGRLHSATEAE